MKNTLKIITFVILPLLALEQRNVFEWGEGLTYYTGKFDTTKYSLQEIEKIAIRVRNLHLIGRRQS